MGDVREGGGVLGVSGTMLLRGGEGAGGRVFVDWHHLSDLLLSCLVAGRHCPSPGPPALYKPAPICAAVTL